MTISKARATANARHNEKLMQIMVKPYIEEGEQIKAAAEQAGQSVQAYILQAVRERMAAEAGAQKPHYKVLVNREKADKAAEKAGKDAKTLLTGIAKEIDKQLE